MNDQVAGQIVEAYKTSPLLTGLLLLNIAFMGGFGYYLMKKEAAVAEYVKMVRGDERQLIAGYTDKLMELASKCASK